jgi:hypothetical protein
MVTVHAEHLKEPVEHSEATTFRINTKGWLEVFEGSAFQGRVIAAYSPGNWLSAVIGE